MIRLANRVRHRQRPLGHSGHRQEAAPSLGRRSALAGSNPAGVTTHALDPIGPKGGPVIFTVHVGWMSVRPIVDQHWSSVTVDAPDATQAQLIAAQMVASRPSCVMPTSTLIAL